MAKAETKRLAPGLLQEDRDIFAAIIAIADYRPVNVALTLDKLQAAAATLTAAQQDEVQKVAAADSARDDAVAREREFHELMLRAKDQVIAQYGRDSNEAQAVGLKKKSERKSPARKAAAPKQ